MASPRCYLHLVAILAMSWVCVLASAQRVLTVADKTQAGCACPATWTYKYNSTRSVKVSGCGNPDSDPKGAWCPVEKQSCPGYYGNLTRLGSTIQFDYCGDVRSVTTAGCLCLPESGGFEQGDGQSKSYQDKCSIPDHSSRTCFVNVKTCKTAYAGKEYNNTYDFCPAPKTPLAAGVPDGTVTTQGGCECAPSWRYYVDGYNRDQKGPFDGCNNDDYDRKGSWCIVNPVKCPSAYGSFVQGGKTIFYAYCGNVLEVTNGGCFCKPSWGAGKMQDSCANPDGKPAKWCEIMPGTCKTTPFNTTWDYCEVIQGVTDTPTTTDVTRSSPTAGAPVVVVVSGNDTARSSSSGDSSGSSSGGNSSKKDSSNEINKVILLVPLLTGIAAIVTIAYTLYKCHKKRQFFKSGQMLKLASVINNSHSNPAPTAASGPGSAARPPDTHAVMPKSPTTRNVV